MSREKKEAELPPELETQFILRLPEEPAIALRDVLRSGEHLKNRLTIEVESDMRHGEVRFDHWLMHAKIVDLPTITESLKTIDNKSFYKTADVSQMMVCTTELEQSSVEEESPSKNKKKDPLKVDKKYLWPHGVTPPTKNVRKKRFRKTLRKKCAEAPEVEKEVKRLLRADNEAATVTWEIITEEDQVLKHETVTRTPKLERKKKERSIKKEPSIKVETAEATNVVDIFGGTVSDSDAEDGTINVEVEDPQIIPLEFVIPTYNEVTVESEPMKGKRHRSKKNKDKKKSKKKNKDKEEPTCTVTSEQVYGDERDYKEQYLSKDDMTARIEKVRSELDELKLQKIKTQNELIGLDNDSLKQRFLDALHSLNQDVMYKEMEYQGLITLQNSDEI